MLLLAGVTRARKGIAASASTVENQRSFVAAEPVLAPSEVGPVAAEYVAPGLSVATLLAAAPPSVSAVPRHVRIGSVPPYIVSAIRPLAAAIRPLAAALPRQRF